MSRSSHSFSTVNLTQSIHFVPSRGLMDLETESASGNTDARGNKIADAGRKRRCPCSPPPTQGGRPNSWFLSATVLAAQQANRTAEVSESGECRRKSWSYMTS
ncbi:uncharacterized protein LOC131249890 [Magnolia sinica]|uniref:uncharacterized protein LOC131249890 n=1 Tax=Magnolia sinica TaxID=86752 RepID=UPI0026598797|nr:uncharacterized protein LOC131249890 [Magnolia sinica]